MENYRKIKGKNVPAVESQKVEIPFDFATLDELLAAVGDNLFGVTPAACQKVIIRIPANAQIPAGAKPSVEMVKAWNFPKNNNPLRRKFDYWKKNNEKYR